MGVTCRGYRRPEVGLWGKEKRQASQPVGSGLQTGGRFVSLRACYDGPGKHKLGPGEHAAPGRRLNERGIRFLLHRVSIRAPNGRRDGTPSDQDEPIECKVEKLGSSLEGAVALII